MKGVAPMNKACSVGLVSFGGLSQLSFMFDPVYITQTLPFGLLLTLIPTRSIFLIGVIPKPRYLISSPSQASHRFLHFEILDTLAPFHQSFSITLALFKLASRCRTKDTINKVVLNTHNRGKQNHEHGEPRRATTAAHSRP